MNGNYYMVNSNAYKISEDVERETPVVSAVTPDLNVLFNEWVNYVDRTEKTVQTYTRAIRQFGKWLNDNGIIRPTETDVRNYRDELMTDHKPTTTQAYLTAIKLFFKWTEKSGYYPNVAERVNGVKIDNTLPKKGYLTVNQVKELLTVPNRQTDAGKRDYAILVLMLTTGLRTVEVIRADVGDIDTIGNDHVLFIRGKGKSDKTQSVKITGAVEQAITEYIKTRGKVTSNEPLFTSDSNRNYGERLTTKSISRIVKTALIGIGLNSDKYTAHSLRHTVGTQNILNGGSLQETQQLLRHTNPTTTLIYVNVVNRINNKSEQRLTELFID